MDELTTNCLKCGCSLYDFGEGLPTTQGYFIRCKNCSTVYQMLSAQEIDGRTIVWLEPVSVTQETFEKEFAKDIERSQNSDLKTKIQQAKTPKQLLDLLQENDH